jgi:hypothetical protein
MLVYFSLQLFELLNLLSTLLSFISTTRFSTEHCFFYHGSHEAFYQNVPSPTARPGPSVMPTPRTRSHIAGILPQQKPCPLSHCPTQIPSHVFQTQLLRPDTLRNNKTLSYTASDWQSIKSQTPYIRKGKLWRTLLVCIRYQPFYVVLGALYGCLIFTCC